MKWNGIVSQLGQANIATRFAAANVAHAKSMRSGRRRESIAGMANRFDRCCRPELLPQSPHANLDNVRSRVEVVSPYFREQALATDHLARVNGELVQEAELAVGEIADEVA